MPKIRKLHDAAAARLEKTVAILNTPLAQEERVEADGPQPEYIKYAAQSVHRYGQQGGGIYQGR